MDDVREVPRRGENGNAFECAECVEVGIARNQAIDLAGMRGVEEFVILRIATDMKQAPRGDHFAVAHQDYDGAFAGFGRHVAIELLTCDDFKQFVPRRGRENQCGVLGEEAKQSAGNRLREEDAADNRVRIDDNTLTGLHRSCA